MTNLLNSNKEKIKFALLAARLQLIYISRPHCRVRDKMTKSFQDNIEEGGIERHGKLWKEIMARWLAATSESKRREELLDPCIDALEELLGGNQ